MSSATQVPAKRLTAAEIDAEFFGDVVTLEEPAGKGDAAVPAAEVGHPHALASEFPDAPRNGAFVLLAARTSEEDFETTVLFRANPNIFCSFLLPPKTKGAADQKAHSDVGAAQAAALALGSKWAGPVGGGACCRCTRCTRCFAQSRNAFDVAQCEARPNAPPRVHVVHERRLQAEFFWIRTIFYCSITLLAIANSFLNPDLLGAAAAVGAKDAAMEATQIVRFALCAIAVSAPSALLLVFLPNKHGSRW